MQRMEWISHRKIKAWALPHFNAAANRRTSFSKLIRKEPTSFTKESLLIGIRLVYGF